MDGPKGPAQWNASTIGVSVANVPGAQDECRPFVEKGTGFEDSFEYMMATPAVSEKLLEANRDKVLSNNPMCLSELPTVKIPKGVVAEGSVVMLNSVEYEDVEDNRSSPLALSRSSEWKLTAIIEEFEPLTAQYEEALSLIHI